MANTLLRLVGKRMSAEFARRPREVIDGVIHVPLKPTDAKPDPSSSVLRAGTVVTKGALALPDDIQVDRDVAITLRDGVTLYADVFRPTGDEPVPAILVWSSYGKRNTHSRFVNVPGLKLSGLQKFEGPDPAYWVGKGYAIVNIDARGAFLSGGRLPHWGRQEGQDGYDAVEWAAEQAWCTGSVGFAGNSWLGITQWFIAAEQPPHLTAIAPWEALADGYRHSTVPGGVPRTNFPNLVMAVLLGGNQTAEDIGAMAQAHPLVDDYWKDKTARLEDVTVPAYVVASYASKTHTCGTVHGFNGIASREKWLRIHNTHEWPDFYEYQDDLLRFFDHYLRGQDNGWETTPRVRMSILDPGGVDTVGLAEEAFPPTRAAARSLHLDASDAGLRATAPVKDATVRLPLADGRSRLSFTHRFDADTEIAGFPILRFWVELEGCDDADLYVQAEKLDSNGSVLPVIVRGAPTSGKHGAPYEWGNGILRLSHRKVDPTHLASGVPQLAHDELQPVVPGEVVLAQIELPPMAMRWRAGEQLLIRLSGFDPQAPELPFESPEPVRNVRGGVAIVHTGPSWPGALELPVLEPRRES